MATIKLNLGCGFNKLAGFQNVDIDGDPDIRHDLESFPWPWADSSVAEIVLSHVLEHLGKSSDTYIRIFKEMYRICVNGALVRITVPHPRHDHFLDDPTHVRAVTPLGICLFSKRMNSEWIAARMANSPLAIYHDVDFELVETIYVPSDLWFRLHPDRDVDLDRLLFEGSIYNNLIQETRMVAKIIK